MPGDKFAKKTAKYLYQNCKFCSEHFVECMFSKDGKTRRKRDAKSTLFNIPNAPKKWFKDDISQHRIRTKKVRLQFLIMLLWHKAEEVLLYIFK